MEADAAAMAAEVGPGWGTHARWGAPHTYGGGSQWASLEIYLRPNASLNFYPEGTNRLHFQMRI